MTPTTHQGAIMNITTAADTDDIFLGSGALGYSWWSESVVLRTETSWALRGEIDETPFRLGHAEIMDAVDYIARTGTAYVSRSCLNNCIALREGRDCDFDADDADQVLQVAAMGEVVFG